MILRQFLTLTQNASPERRAEAAGALTRSYLQGTLGPEAAWEAKTTLLALLDDPAAAVRRALAQACADSDQAPRPLIVALASDQPDIACLVLARSPVLMDADLVDCVAMGCEETRTAVAGRLDLSKPVAAALAEVGGPPSLIALAQNPFAAIGTAALLRMVERHGDNAALRQALLARTDLAIEVRHAIVTLIAEQLSRFGQDAGWISSERGARTAREARDAAALALSDEAGEAGLARLVAHLRVQEQLTAGLMLRAVLSLRLPFAEMALAELSGLSRARVAGLMREPQGAGFSALHRRAGLPDLLLPAVRAALTVWRDSNDGRNGIDGPRLARSMIEAALTACETLPFTEARGLMALLARFEAEAARDEARILAHEQAEAQARETGEAAILLTAPASVEVVATTAPSEILVLSPASATLEPNMPDASTAWPLAPRPEDRIGATVVSAGPDAAIVPDSAEIVLAGLADAIIAQFMADRAAASAPIPALIAAPSPEPLPEIVPELLPELVPELLPELLPEISAESLPEIVVAPKRIARPRAIAVAVAAGMIPEHLILSYRADRERLAA
ncbi:DUF2336 domain-containing protein [Methylorubrum extorquens]|uniref:DUF2336 domain-containing protein n=1 Tax=Methylorubrum extorquens TaxID=408 RepID=UPI000158F228|nr:DUF2336 domain-containing protein [Methylorubrum extorquens]ABY30704.1 conserved hypothetical proteinn [Methylorubrum extorquens PA1]KQP87449.1 hypothetical protein ASF55_06325 [Methylobacterium sp. Leaf119]WIU41972.1 DUF2336 domain-containing protein [Methylorubrum extorquens]